MTPAPRWPKGVVSSGVACGIKGAGETDLGLMVADAPVVWAGVFTRNAAAAASVDWCKGLLGRPVRAVVVNSGNANSCTGATGVAAVGSTVAAASSVVGCSPEEVLVASTGPIGVQLPVGRIAVALPGAAEALEPGVESFATAIMTTDTHPKTAAASAGEAAIVGVAKGAAMLAPNMATMLAFVVTDAAVDFAALQAALWTATEPTFNRLQVDGCESTNDSAIVLATGTAGPPGPEFEAGLTSVCASLAQQMAQDAEGSTRIMRVRVTGAEDDAHALALARAVAGSVLWRAAVHGADSNWGRVLAALGAQDRDLLLNEVTLALDGTTVFSGGEPRSAPGEVAFVGPEIVVECGLGGGPGRAEVLSTDLSPGYVELNAAGTS